jgi:hypothetical protein
MVGVPFLRADVTPEAVLEPRSPASPRVGRHQPYKASQLPKPY